MTLPKKLYPLALRLGATAVMWASMGLAVQAQTLPNAGALQQNIKRERAPQGRPKVEPQLQVAPESAPAAPDALSFMAGEFRITGNTLLSAEQLAPVLEPYRKRTLRFADLQDAANFIAGAYRDADLVARVELPEQDITAGVVTLRVIEARLGRVVVEGAPSARARADDVQAIFTAALLPGQPLHVRALDRALLLANDLPGVEVTGALHPGASEGLTDVVLTLTDTPVFSADAALDNTGVRSTGAQRLSANLNLHSPLGQGEQLEANLIHSEGSDYLRLGSSVALGGGGWRLGASASGLRYHVTPSEFAILNAYGTATTATLEATYPVLRSRLRNVNLSLTTERKWYDNHALQTTAATSDTTSHYQSSTAGLRLSANQVDAWGGGGSSSASLGLLAGDLDLRDSPNQASDAAAARTAGRYTKLSYLLSRSQSLGDTLTLLATLSGQVADKNLDASERFYLGGASGVRAYPANEAGGTQATLLNLELRWWLRHNLVLGVLYDDGQMSVHRDSDFAGAPQPNTYRLRGAGLTLQWQPDARLGLSATWARRLGDNPNPTATGNDQDGSLQTDRFWLTARYTY